MLNNFRKYNFFYVADLRELKRFEVLETCIPNDPQNLKTSFTTPIFFFRHRHPWSVVACYLRLLRS